LINGDVGETAGQGPAGGRSLPADLPEVFCASSLVRPVTDISARRLHKSVHKAAIMARMSAGMLPPDDRRRAAALLMATLDDGDVSAVLQEAYESPGGLMGMVAALVTGCLELLASIATEEQTRAFLNTVILDASLDV
jgi:hypothetical protein